MAIWGIPFSGERIQPRRIDPTGQAIPFFDIARVDIGDSLRKENPIVLIQNHDGFAREEAVAARTSPAWGAISEARP